ncbi:hypothetical protein IMCC13023_02060 [Candidatus Aquiluna sp. IMCC13023]|nr:hypothetical protein IMCC13023_02060 [Candidatus Aquiluna sp. IMCC13023]
MSKRKKHELDSCNLFWNCSERLAHRVVQGAKTMRRVE